MSQLQAILWDVDGTLAETERDGHRVAFNRAFEAKGLPWRWDEAHYGELLRVAGGRERLLHDMASRPDAPPLADERTRLARELHMSKNALFGQWLRASGTPLRPGVLPLMQQCREHGIRMGITTTTSRINLQALMQSALGPRWADWFAVVICGEDVQRKKPDPEVYQRALQALDLPPLAVVAIEDSPGGVAAARAADIPVVVTRSHYFAQATIEGAIAIGPGLHQREGWRPALRGTHGPVGLDDLQAWCSEMDSVSQFG
ncbi:MAG: HAD-IA family hydrolase [Burkholderiales bacterium]|nr:HAD-IA family hydrolase [Burkholderiales bacterium]